MGKKLTRRGRTDFSAVLARIHSVSIECPTVIEFGDQALRESFRLWWHPNDMGPDFNVLTGQDEHVSFKRGKLHGFKSVPAKHPVMSGRAIERRRLDPGYYRRIDRAMGRFMSGGRKRLAKRRKLPSAKRAPVKVRIALNYPLSETRTKIVVIDRRYPGEIFALTHDFYRELYAEDEKSGGEAGPMNGGQGPLLNRGRGPLVWGHDLGDLCFESCRYKAFDKGMAKRTGAEGEFTFGIGS